MALEELEDRGWGWRRWSVFAGIALCLALGAGYLVHRLRKPEPPKYEMQAADRGSVVARVTATGILSALVTVQVGAQVSGRVSELHADFNSPVTKGELIAKIDPQLFQASLEQNRANYDAAKAATVKARVQAADAVRIAGREKQLREQNLVAQADADTAQANADALVAAVDSSVANEKQNLAQLHMAQVNLQYTDIISPINGVVISRAVELGQTVASALQTPTLFTIAEDLKRMQVDTSIAEADVGKLQPGQQAIFIVDAFPSDRFKGVIRQIRNAATTLQNVVTYDAVIDVENPDLKLRPGMTANVTVVYAEKRDVLRVSNSALRFRPSAELLAGPGALKDTGRHHVTDASAPVASATPAAVPPLAGNPTPTPAAADARGSGRGRGGSGGNGGGGGGGNGNRPGPNAPRTIWVMRQGQPQQLSLKLGVTDGTFTEVTDGDLHEGDPVITSSSAAEAATEKQQNRMPGMPGMGPPGGGGGGRRF